MSDLFPVPAGYRVVRAGEEGSPDAPAIRDLLLRSSSYDSETAARRSLDALSVALDSRGVLAATVLGELRYSGVLGLSMWHLAAYVDASHRRSGVGLATFQTARELLTERFATSEDRRGAGIMLEFQHQGLREHYTVAELAGFSHLGHTVEGHPRGVCYFDGAVVPEPPHPAEAPGPSEAPARVERPRPTGPIVVVGAPGARTEALRDALAAATGARVAEIGPPPATGDQGARLTADDADGPTAVEGRALVSGFHDALRIPFLHAALPDATFVFVHRDPAAAVPAALARWRAQDAVTAPELPGWDGPPWSLALTPLWRSLRDRPLAEVVGAQWEAATRILVADLQRLPADRWSVVDHDALVADPRSELARLADFAGLELEGEKISFPAAREPGLGESDRADLERGLALTWDTAAVARTLFPDRPEDTPVEWGAEVGVRTQVTESLASVLRQLRASLVVSTPGALATVSRRGETVHTHLLPWREPTGLAHRPGRLAVASATSVAEHVDIPAARNRLAGPVSRDACFVPHVHRETGDIGIGEVAYAGDELWLVSSRFSCLATLDDRHSFEPRWQPPFVSALTAEDRCHLSGVCVGEDGPRYVTALGATDIEGGWRDRVGDGGVVVDVGDGRTVADGLATPFSPRWHRDRLWVLLGGEGTLATVDPGDGSLETVARVPGFARGLAFLGPLAFVGVSARRGGDDPRCGVWAIETDTGSTVAILEFTAGVREVTDVQVLPGIAYPEVLDADSDAARNSFLLP